MIKVADCVICGEHLVGEDVEKYKLGGNYYCSTHYFIYGEDRSFNRQMELDNQKFERILSDYENLLDSDFDNWTASGITVSGNELTVSGSGTLRYETTMDLGTIYLLKSRIDKNGIAVSFKNYKSDDSIQQIIDNGTFASVGKSFILLLTGTGTVTIHELRLRNV